MALSYCKKSSALLRGITSNHVGDFYCINCFHSLNTKSRLKKHVSVWKDHDYCYKEMPKKDNKVLRYNHGGKSIKASFIIYADMDSLLEKIYTRHNNTKKVINDQIN